MKSRLPACGLDPQASGLPRHVKTYDALATVATTVSSIARTLVGVFTELDTSVACVGLGRRTDSAHSRPQKAIRAQHGMYFEVVYYLEYLSMPA